MYNIRKVTMALFVLLLTFFLCACGSEVVPSSSEKSESIIVFEPGKEDPAESTHVQTESVAVVHDDLEIPKVELPVEGEYKAYALTIEEGYLVFAADVEFDSTIILDEGGIGTLVLSEDTWGMITWTAEGSALTITMDEGTIDAIVDNGILILDITGDKSMPIYYAQDEADKTGIYPMMLDEVLAALEGPNPDSKIGALWSELNIAAGIHLRYDINMDYMDSLVSTESMCKNNMFYSYTNTILADYQRPSILVMRDDNAYLLDPRVKNGVINTAEWRSDIFALSKNIMMPDSLYSVIWSYAHKANFTEETWEKDGVSYEVEYFPADEYYSECSFYFDENGQLVYIEKGEPVSQDFAETGECTFTIYAIDTKVNESLFDISGYEITDE